LTQASTQNNVPERPKLNPITQSVARETHKAPVSEQTNTAKPVETSNAPKLVQIETKKPTSQEQS